MYLDISTLLLLLGTLCCVVGGTLLWFWFSTRQEQGLLWWGASFLVRCPAFPLLMARGSIDDRLSIDLAISFLMLGLGLSWAGARRFSGNRLSVPVILAPAVVWLAACQVPAFHADTSSRMLLISCMITLYSVAMVVEFRRESAGNAWLRKGLAVLIAINAAAHGARALYVVMNTLPYDILGTDNWLAATLYLPMVLLMVGAVLGVAMNNDRTMRALRMEADYDSLTNVLTRKAVFTLAEDEISRVRQHGGSICLLLFDLDHFKTINDSHGHAAGDVVLKRFCDAIRARLRKSDLFGRIGGEEFVAVLPDVDCATACGIADELRRAIDDLTILHAGQRIPVSVSIGVSDTAGAGAALDKLMQRADEALYSAKQQGRNQVKLGVFAPALAMQS